MANTQGVISNASELDAKLKRMGKQIEDSKPILVQARRLMQIQEKLVFATEGEALSEVWAALVEPERKTDPDMLVASGDLRTSVTRAGSGRISKNALRYGTTVFYGRFHQYGTAKMQPRVFLGISEETSKELGRLFDAQVGEILSQ